MSAMNATSVPSGDHAGERESSVVSSCEDEPSAFITATRPLPFGRRSTYAILLPSGDQAGSSPSARAVAIPVVRLIATATWFCVVSKDAPVGDQARLPFPPPNTV